MQSNKIHNVYLVGMHIYYKMIHGPYNVKLLGVCLRSTFFYFPTMHLKSKNCDINTIQQNNYFSAVFNAQNKVEVQYTDRKYKNCCKTAKEEKSVECYYTDKKNIRGLK